MMAILMVVLVTVPLAAAAMLFASHRVHPVLSAVTALGLALAVALLGFELVQHGEMDYALGGWGQPLGIHWRLTGSAWLMLAASALVGAAGTLFGLAQVRTAYGHAWSFIPPWLFTWGGLNALFIGNDLFNLYVALEVISLASVAMVATSQRSGAVRAAMRYLLSALIGSTIYLLGVALLYGQYGLLDLSALEAAMTADAEAPGARLAAATLTVGLLLKAAIFPLHFWLPGAHSRAEAPVSAMLSALVVAAALVLLIRLWFGPLGVLLTPASAQLLGLLGGLALFWGGLQALQQKGVKLLIAYSTISQFGFVMLAFPLGAAADHRTAAQGAAVLLLANHALAKAALFLAAGALVRLSRSERVDALQGAGGKATWAWLAIAMAAGALIGIPPSLGFHAKWQLLESAIVQESWLWLAVALAGTLLTFAYLFRLLERAARPPRPAASLPRAAGCALLIPPYLLALLAMTSGLAGGALGELVGIDP